MLSKPVSRALTTCIPINEKIIEARFTYQQAKLTVFPGYAPAKNADYGKKNSFQNTLHTDAKDIPVMISSAF